MSFNQYVFCISGRLSKTRGEMEIALRQMGAKDVKKSVTRSVTHLIVPDLHSIDNTNSKVIAARTNGIDIVDEKWIYAQTPCTEKAPMLEFNVLLAKKYKEQDVNGWWCSEKLDGIRAIWDGSRFWSRSGNRIQVPAEFCAEFPPVVMDGELFGGRGEFNETSGIVRTHDGTYDQWSGLEFCVFDTPAMDKLPFEERIDYLKKLICGQKHLKLCNHQKISKDDVTTLLTDVLAAGGEGLMLRKPGSLYEYKRSGTLLKVKVMHDAECTVIGHEDGLGKYRGMCGALMCQYRGKMFKVGSGLTDDDRRNPPRMGAIITFGYLELSKKGIPRHPTFKREFKGRV